MGYIYLISKDADAPPTKVGKSSNPLKRLNQLRRAHGKELQLQFVYKTDRMDEAEQEVLDTTEDASVGGTEWRILPAREIAEHIEGTELEPVSVSRLLDNQTEPPNPTTEGGLMGGETVRFNARIPENLRDAFSDLCENEITTMSRAIKQYMVEAVEQDELDAPI